MESDRRCPKCNADVVDNSAFCSACGHELPSTRAGSHVLLKVLGIVFAIALTLAAILWVYYLSGRNDWIKDSQLEMRSGNYNGAVTRLYSFQKKFHSAKCGNAVVEFLEEQAAVDKDIHLLDVDFGGTEEPEKLITYSGPEDNRKNFGTVVATQRNDLWQVVLRELGISGTPTHTFKLNGDARGGVILKRGSSKTVFHVAKDLSKLSVFEEYSVGHVQFRDLDRDGIIEIVSLGPNYHHFGARYCACRGAIEYIWRWNGNAFVESNSRFPGFFRSKLREEKAKLAATREEKDSCREDCVKLSEALIKDYLDVLRLAEVRAGG